MARVVGLARENLKEVPVGIFSSIRHFFIHQVDTSNAVSWVCAGQVTEESTWSCPSGLSNRG